MAEVPPELAAEVQKLERYHAENPQGRYFVPLANAYRKMGALDQAEALLREGLRRHPDYLSAHIVLGRCLADRGATGDAIGEFRYVLSVDPQNLIALRSLGEMASEEGRDEEAARWYRELLAVDPMNDDARQALQGLEARPAPSALAGEEELEGTAAPTKRPAEEAPAADDALPASGIVDDDLIWNTGAEPSGPAAEPARGPDEPMAWGSVDLDATTGADAPAGADGPAEDASAAEPFAALSFGDLELADAAPDAAAAQEPAEPWTGAETPGGWDPYSGSTVDLETPAFTGGEPAAAGEEDEVVTETIAELYARQGFHDRAADVYRELIRRRGGDPALEARLGEVERLASGEAVAEGPAPAFAGEEPALPEAGTDPDDLPLLDWSVDEAGGAPAREPGELVDEEPMPYPTPASEGEDAFAGSFEEGFGEGTVGPTGLRDAFDGFAPEPDELSRQVGDSLPWASADSEAEEVAAIFAREEAFFDPAPDEQAGQEEERIVVASAAAELLGAGGGYAADEPAPEEPAGYEAPAADLALPDSFDAAEPRLEAPADEPFAAAASLDEPGGTAAAVDDPAAGPALPVEAAAPAAEYRSVRDYLSGLAGWQPGGAAAPAEEAPSAAVERAAAFEPVAESAYEPPEVAPSTMEEVPPAVEHTAAGAFHDAAAEDEEDDMPWLAAPVSEDPGDGAVAEPMEIDGLLAAESAGAAASAAADDDEPYPWELAPAGTEPAPETPAQAGPPSAEESRPAPGFSFEEFFVEPAEAPAPPAPSAPEPRVPEPPRAEEPPVQAAAAGEDDEDLESFQAWLQSLKR